MHHTWDVPLPAPPPHRRHAPTGTSEPERPFRVSGILSFRALSPPLRRGVTAGFHRDMSWILSCTVPPSLLRSHISKSRRPMETWPIHLRRDPPKASVDLDDSSKLRRAIHALVASGGSRCDATTATISLHTVDVTEDVQAEGPVVPLWRAPL